MNNVLQRLASATSTTIMEHAMKSPITYPSDPRSSARWSALAGWSNAAMPPR